MIHRFSRLIDKYTVTDAVLLQGGSETVWGDDGLPVTKPPTRVPLPCAIVPMSSKEVYDTNGRYTTQDRTIYSKTKLTIKDQISYRDAVYSIEEETDYSAYADFFMYRCKAVSKHG